jgi:hypothetical protein
VIPPQQEYCYKIEHKLNREEELKSTQVFFSNSNSNSSITAVTVKYQQ